MEGKFPLWKDDYGTYFNGGMAMKGWPSQGFRRRINYECGLS